MSIVSVEKDVEALSLTIVAEFDAPIERVWELWADPRKLERWWGPPASLDFTDGFAYEETPITTVQVRLAEHGTGTRMRLRFAFESNDHMVRLERWGAFDVFPLSVGQMDALLR